jgi:hypothetical protein
VRGLEPSARLNELVELAAAAYAAGVKQLARVVRTITTKVWACGPCTRCEHEWEAQGDEPPARCASCKSPYWNVEPGTVPRGRPPAPKKTAR